LSKYVDDSKTGFDFPQRAGHFKESASQWRNELPIPLDFSLIFAFDYVKKRLHVYCNERGYEYTGQGRFSRGKNIIYVPGLECLDPITEDTVYIQGCHLGLFMRVLLPEIRKAIPAECLIKNDDRPPVTITILEWSGSQAVIDVLWKIPQSALRDCGCPDLCLAGDTLYVGETAFYQNLSYHQSGRYFLDKHECAVLEILMVSRPALFEAIPQLAALTPQKAEPIVPRKAGRQFAGPILLSITVSPALKDPPERYLDFVKEARLKKEWRGEATPSLPFTSYWPTYAVMSPGQKQWYFYWRSRALAEEYPPCDLSYLFIYIYELINNIHDNALKRLYSLWVAYRGSHPELDVYLPLWILDYILTYHEENLFDLCNLTAHFPLQRFPLLQYSEIFFNETLKNGFSALPPDILLSVADYDQKMCKVPVDRLCQAVRGLELSFTRRSTTLLESFKPRPFTLERESFRSAVKGRRANRLIKIEYLPYFTQPAFRKLLKNTLRYGENILREELGIAGRFKISGLSPEIKKCITQAILSVDTGQRRHLEVNIDIARAIEAVSWQMTRQLIVEEDDANDFSVLPQPNDAKSDRPGELDINGRTCDRDAQDTFVARLSAAQRQFLLALLERKPVDGLCAQAFMLPEAIAEQINEIAHGYFGDTVVDTAKLEIYSEYMPAIADQLENKNV
jgi:hypothetical protein